MLRQFSLALFALLAVSDIKNTNAIVMNLVQTEEHKPVNLAQLEVNMKPRDVDNMMKIVPIEKDGKITKQGLIAGLEELAKLVHYSLSVQDLGEVGYLWSIMDVKKSNLLTQNEVRRLLQQSVVGKTVRDYGRKMMDSKELRAKIAKSKKP